MSTMKAAMITGEGISNIVVAEIERPVPRQGEILVRIHAASLVALEVHQPTILQNPADWKLAKSDAYKGRYPVQTGCDLAGVVVAVGPNCSKLQLGDSVAGFTRLTTRRGRGGYSEYAIMDELYTMKMPAYMPFTEATSFGVGYLTSVLAINHHMRIPLPPAKVKDADFVLVWGASSSCGLFAVQILKLAGMRVIGTASPRNHDYVKSLGAEFVVDSNSPSVLTEIKRITGDSPLKWAVDCIGSETALATLTPGIPTQLATISGAPAMLPSPSITHHPVYLGDYIHVPAKKAFLENFVQNVANPLLFAGKEPIIIGNRALILGGLDQVATAFKMSSEGRVSGQKLVVIPGLTRPESVVAKM
ncbi:hypothetical protein SmJEL517_g03377 [Synchytrium microbalum]|uniref:Enoyl reductase (ER) domain-containing protein n=1 Tax=Synchytrium microbalum TaxID=1806994 RepID=A0A507C2B6_9FUNG|nr:uncharacterized protein SmJEL517_g03377 [Synchytrium microbalum]TPX33862.1 hypothetical protein SmJEL517_g03377 [Synchytrium microbalum]